MHHVIYTGESEHHLKDGRVGRFKPTGPLHVVHVRSDRGRAREDNKELPYNSTLESWGVEGLAARLFVGLKVGDTLKWTTEDVMKATHGYLTEHAGLSGNSTFIAQKGWYNGISEDSVQVVVFDEDGVTIDRWTDTVLALGAFLREHFEQESVIVEIQRGGVAQSLQAVKERS